MSTNHTTNYDLNQWEGTDKVLRAEFNADNAKIDAALKANSDAVDSLETQLVSGLAGKGNCQLWTTSYVGDDQVTYNSNNRITFPKLPVLVIIQGTNGGETMLILGQNTKYLTIMGTAYGGSVTWEGTTMSWRVNTTNPSDQFNLQGATYLVLALLPAEE